MSSSGSRPSVSRMEETRPSARNAARRGEGASRVARSHDDAQEDELKEAKAPSRFASLKRRLTKDKADRAFERQFGGSSAPSDSSEAKPRAAVYKGEMGSTHRRSARMQDGAPAQGAAKGRSARGVLSSLKSSPKFLSGMAALACLALSCLFLYPAAQQYYHASRENDRLQAEYVAIEQRNATIQNEVDSLKTESGVKARAHEQFGWVEEGEQSAVVQGLDSEAEETDFLANIPSESVDTPDTWYSPVLDAVFGVE